MQYYTVADIFLTPLAIMLVLLAGWFIRSRNKEDLRYRFLLPALSVKLLGTLFFCFIYTFYYNGGDTTGYFHSAGTLINVISEDVGGFFKIMFEGSTEENFSYFNIRTGYPWYWMDNSAYMVVRLTVPFRLLSLGSFPVGSILVSTCVFAALWRLYLSVSNLLKTNHFWLMVAVVMVPSVVFWAGGILKDSYTLIALCICVTSILDIYTGKKKWYQRLISLVVFGGILLLVKAYILIALIPAAVIMFAYNRIRKIRNFVVRVVAAPIVIAIGVLAGYGLTSLVGAVDSNYAEVNVLVELAHSKQNDLKQAYYGGNAFDIGEFEPTVSGALRMAPSAITAGLFRPYPWEAKNIVMALSSFENMLILLGCCYVILFKLRSLVRGLRTDPFQLFCLVFVITLAFIIGISTSNFGSLVRFKIPLLPFLLIFLVQVIRRKDTAQVPELV